jgi:NADPH:quinone reductase-like Zn-dependent oxidoreductase
MYAYRVDEVNGTFSRVDVPRPALSENNVLIRIQASGVNPLDTKIRAEAAAHAKQPLPAILGLDMAGTVEEVGNGVTRFKPGDEVYGMVGA